MPAADDVADHDAERVRSSSQNASYQSPPTSSAVDGRAGSVTSTSKPSSRGSSPGEQAALEARRATSRSRPRGARSSSRS